MAEGERSEGGRRWGAPARELELEPARSPWPDLEGRVPWPARGDRRAARRPMRGGRRAVWRLALGGRRAAPQAARLAVAGRGRRKVNLTCGPHMSDPRLTRIIVIWTSREPINNFGDPESHFWEFGDRDNTAIQI